MEDERKGKGGILLEVDVRGGKERGFREAEMDTEEGRGGGFFSCFLKKCS